MSSCSASLKKPLRHCRTNFDQSVSILHACNRSTLITSATHVFFPRIDFLTIWSDLKLAHGYHTKTDAVSALWLDISRYRVMLPNIPNIHIQAQRRSFCRLMVIFPFDVLFNWFLKKFQIYYEASKLSTGIYVYGASKWLRDILQLHRRLSIFCGYKPSKNLDCS